MKRSLLAVSLLSLALSGVGNAQGTATSPESGATYTKAQVKQLALNAHTPTQFSALAGYFGEQRDKYLQKAAKEKKEWLELSWNAGNTAAKYPKPADSARNAYEYYTQKASEAGVLEAKFSHMASPDTLVNAQ
ncbi:MAG: hypothetical protein ABSB60_14065 [Terracidiphilus sp.]